VDLVVVSETEALVPRSCPDASITSHATSGRINNIANRDGSESDAGVSSLITPTNNRSGMGSSGGNIRGHAGGHVCWADTEPGVGADSRSSSQGGPEGAGERNSLVLCVRKKLLKQGDRNINNPELEV
jgi:hypothetical protein